MDALMPSWMWRMNAQLLYALIITLTLTGCPKRPPTYDAASKTCTTGYGFIARTNDESHCEELQSVEEASTSVWLDAGLLPADGGIGNARWFKGVVLAVHPDSDGVQWRSDGGVFNVLYGDSSEACPQLGNQRKTMWLANTMWTHTPFCHEGTHILRACSPWDHTCYPVKNQLSDGGVKNDLLCTGWFIDNKIDQKCGEAMKELKR